MVRVSASGEVVTDDSKARATRRHDDTTQSQARRMGRIHHNDDEREAEGSSGRQSVSIFHTLNQKLLDAGIPRWNLGSTTIEPIVTLGFLLAMLLLGMKGLLLGGVLFAAVKYSNDSGGIGGARNNSSGRRASGGRTVGSRR